MITDKIGFSTCSFPPLTLNERQKVEGCTATCPKRGLESIERNEKDRAGLNLAVSARCLSGPELRDVHIAGARVFSDGLWTPACYAQSIWLLRRTGPLLAPTTSHPLDRYYWMPQKRKESAFPLFGQAGLSQHPESRKAYGSGECSREVIQDGALTMRNFLVERFLRCWCVMNRRRVKRCLAFGVCLVLISVTFAFYPDEAAASGESITFSEMDAVTITGEWNLRNRIELKALDSMDRALIVWEGLAIDSRKFDYLSISVDNLPRELDLAVVWRSDAEEAPGSILIPRSMGARMTVPVYEAEGWKGRISLFGIVVENSYGVPLARKPDLDVAIATPLLEGPKWGAGLRAQVTAWLSPQLFSGRTINTFGQWRPAGTVPPLFIGYGVAVLLVVVGGITGLFTSARQRVVVRYTFAGLVVAHFIALTPLWRDLAANLAEAHDTYVGIEDPLKATPAAYLYDIATTVKAKVVHPDARIFVASNQQFIRERVNYFLAPYNVAPFFDNSYRSTRHEAPASGGDYVLVFADADLDWNPVLGVLGSRWHEYEAMPVWGNEYATLFRIGRAAR